MKFDHEVPTVVGTICDLMVGIFEHMNIKYIQDVDERFKYFEHILKGYDLKKFRTVLILCMDNVASEDGDNRKLGYPKDVYMDEFWALSKVDGLYSDSDKIIGGAYCK